MGVIIHGFRSVVKKEHLKDFASSLCFVAVAIAPASACGGAVILPLQSRFFRGIPKALCLFPLFRCRRHSASQLADTPAQDTSGPRVGTIRSKVRKKCGQKFQGSERLVPSIGTTHPLRLGGQHLSRPQGDCYSPFSVCSVCSVVKPEPHRSGSLGDLALPFTFRVFCVFRGEKIDPHRFAPIRVISGQNSSRTVFPSEHLGSSFRLRIKLRRDTLA
jgi:hypothetical protein